MFKVVVEKILDERVVKSKWVASVTPNGNKFFTIQAPNCLCLNHISISNNPTVALITHFDVIIQAFFHLWCFG